MMTFLYNCPYLREIHGFFFATAIVGFILLAYYAFHNLKGPQLKKLVKWLLIIGIVGSILTASFSRGGYKHKRGMYVHKSEKIELMKTHLEEVDHEDHDAILEMMQDSKMHKGMIR